MKDFSAYPALLAVRGTLRSCCSSNHRPSIEARENSQGGWLGVAPSSSVCGRNGSRGEHGVERELVSHLAHDILDVDIHHIIHR
jgi:hypothetical protein